MSTVVEIWLSDDTTTISLGDNAKIIELSGSDREFEVIEFARSNGGYLRGIGNYTPKTFSITRDDFVESGDIHAWNSQRNDFMKWFTKPVYEDLYLNMRDGENTKTLQTKVYSMKLPEDSFDETWNSNFGRVFELIAPSGIWETTTQISTSIAIASSNEQEVYLTNNGIIEAAPVFSFTPGGAGSIFQVKLAEGYAFRLEGSFSANVQISYNMNDGVLTIGGAEVDASNYLTAGSPFLYPVSATSVFVKGSSGTFTYSFSERYV